MCDRQVWYSECAWYSLTHCGDGGGRGVGSVCVTGRRWYSEFRCILDRSAVKQKFLSGDPTIVFARRDELRFLLYMLMFRYSSTISWTTETHYATIQTIEYLATEPHKLKVGGASSSWDELLKKIKTVRHEHESDPAGSQLASAGADIATLNNLLYLVFLLINGVLLFQPEKTWVSAGPSADGQKSLIWKRHR